MSLKTNRLKNIPFKAHIYDVCITSIKHLTDHILVYTVSIICPHAIMTFCPFYMSPSLFGIHLKLLTFLVDNIHVQDNMTVESPA